MSYSVLKAILVNRLEVHAKKVGLNFTENKNKIINALMEVKKKTGEFLCPCRSKDDKVSCPCKEASEDLKPNHKCTCGLFEGAD